MVKLSTSLYTKKYLEEEEEGWSAIPSGTLLHRIQNRGLESNRLIACMPNGMKIALGDPVRNGTAVSLFLPEWFCELCGIDGAGEEFDITFERSETLPKAKSLSLQVLGTLPDWVNATEILEGPLSQLGVLQVGQIIPFPLFDNLQILVLNCDDLDTHVPHLSENRQRASCGSPIFLDGEANLNIESDPPFTPDIRPPTPIPTQESVVLPSTLPSYTGVPEEQYLSGFFEPGSLPTPIVYKPVVQMPGQGQVLGGNPNGRSRLLDLNKK